MLRNIQLALPSALMMIFSLIPGAVADVETKPLAKTNHLKIVGLPKHVRTGDEIILEALTSPDAQCTITVALGDQQITSEDIQPKVANKDGAVKWQFKATNKPGTLHIYVHSLSGIADVGSAFTVEVKANGG